jgi:hypothetical protein
MRDFSWKYFMMTGDVDAYMLYKEIDDESLDEPDMDDITTGVQDEGLE